MSEPTLLNVSDTPANFVEQANSLVCYQQYVSGQWQTVQKDVIGEIPVGLTVNGEHWLTLMCTPCDLEALAVGFLFNEGLLQEIEEVVSVRVCPTGDNVDVWLSHSVSQPDHWRRTSGCTGGVTATDLLVAPRSILDGVVLTAADVCCLIGQLFEAQDLYQKAGGVHTSALSDGQTILVRAEDIGRHNTLDKISGRCLLENITPDRRILLTTGRISSEMLQKSARIGASIVISRTSPSSLSIRLAEQWFITLIGYADRTRFNVYTHPERISRQA